MSVGVCILNKNGISLAADSAGTLGHGIMFYNSVNKVFKISEKNIIGAITYNATLLNGVPIETILKDFSKYIGNLSEINDFHSIINLLCTFIKDKNSYYNFDNSLYDEIPLTLDIKLKKVNETYILLKSLTKIDDNIIVNLIENDINKNHIEFDYMQYITSIFNGIIESKINQYFQSITKDSQLYLSIKKSLINYINYCWNVKSTIGLLFAGYDSNSALPNFIHLHIGKTFKGDIKFKIIGEEYKMTKAIIVPLAQQEVIYTFCRGISPAVQSFNKSLIKKQIDNKINLIMKTNLPTDLMIYINSLFKNFETIIDNSINTYIGKTNVAGLFKSLNLLPISELALLAENLVNITSLKRHYVIDGCQQSVGGPTDVAIMTKTDGFSWFKHKNQK